MTNLELKSIKVKTRIEKSKRSLKKDRHEAAHAQKQSQSFAPTPVDSLVPTGVSVYSRVRKNKNYELSNHLGNVLAVVSDKRQPHTSNGTTIDYYDPTVLSTQDYYAFGAPMPGRGFTPSTSTYRYGFNGKEKDDEA